MSDKPTEVKGIKARRNQKRLYSCKKWNIKEQKYCSLYFASERARKLHLWECHAIE